jgi:hypothetical protein
MKRQAIALQVTQWFADEAVANDLEMAPVGAE